MNIAIVSYHTTGGSGIVAYEIGLALSEAGHTIHFVGMEPPFRMDDAGAHMMFHSVEVKDYPVFTYPPYTLALASRLFEIIEQYEIDIVHCHYAVPHAIAGILARNMTSRPVKVITTLHGTDITLVGSHPSFYNVTRWAIQQSDAVTAVSDYLAMRTEQEFSLPENSIQRIYNFVPDTYFQTSHSCNGLQCACVGRKTLVHASNLREVKQPLDLIHIFKNICMQSDEDIVLWILGEGPLKCVIEQEAKNSGLMIKFIFGVLSVILRLFSGVRISSFLPVKKKVSVLPLWKQWQARPRLLRIKRADYPKLLKTR